MCPAVARSVSLRCSHRKVKPPSQAEPSHAANGAALFESKAKPVARVGVCCPGSRATADSATNRGAHTVGSACSRCAVLCAAAVGGGEAGEEFHKGAARRGQAHDHKGEHRSKHCSMSTTHKHRAHRCNEWMPPVQWTSAVHHFACRCLPGRPLQRAPREACRATPPGRSEAPLYAAPPRAPWFLLDRISLHAGGLSIRMRRWSCPFVYRQVVRRMRTRTAEPNARPCLSFELPLRMPVRARCDRRFMPHLRIVSRKYDSVLYADFATECALCESCKCTVNSAPFCTVRS